MEFLGNGKQDEKKIQKYSDVRLTPVKVDVYGLSGHQLEDLSKFC